MDGKMENERNRREEKRMNVMYVCAMNVYVRMCLCMYAYDCANMYVSEVIRDREREI